MSERWKAVVGFEGYYEVSSLGRVRSVSRTMWRLNRWGDIAPQRLHGRILRPSWARKYLYLPLKKDGVQYGRAVHRLVLESFVGLRPAGKQAAHGDGNSANNRLTNLSWKTPKENYEDKERHGTVLRGARHPGTELSDRTVGCIRRRYSKGGNQYDLAAEFGVSQQHISNIVCGKRRAHA